MNPSKATLLTALAATAAALALACSPSEEADGDADGDTDTDVDTDADTDADGDGDVDVDTDVDGDGDTDVDTDVDSDVDSDSDGDGDADEDGDDRAFLEGLIAQVSSTICGALDRCCSEGHQAVYFGPYAVNVRLEEAGYASRLPPAATVTAADCPALVAEMLEIVPFGPWVEEALAGHVAFHAEAARACLEALESAACGPEVWEALTDSSCFGFAPPLGGVEQRAVFGRTRGVGEDCVQLTDGQGGGVYGTCDPTVAWCCRPAESDPSLCAIRDGVPGVCAAVAGTGEPCQYFPPPASFCATGSYCDADTSVCVVDAPLAATIPVGETCYEGFVFLGDCIDGWCDLFGDGLCHGFTATGGACESGAECESGACDGGLCIASFCGG